MCIIYYSREYNYLTGTLYEYAKIGINVLSSHTFLVLEISYV